MNTLHEYSSVKRLKRNSLGLSGCSLSSSFLRGCAEYQKACRKLSNFTACGYSPEQIYFRSSCVEHHEGQEFIISWRELKRAFGFKKRWRADHIAWCTSVEKQITAEPIDRSTTLRMRLGCSWDAAKMFGDVLRCSFKARDAASAKVLKVKLRWVLEQNAEDWQETFSKHHFHLPSLESALSTGRTLADHTVRSCWERRSTKLSNSAAMLLVWNRKQYQTARESIENRQHRKRCIRILFLFWLFSNTNSSRRATACMLYTHRIGGWCRKLQCDSRTR